MVKLENLNSGNFKNHSHTPVLGMVLKQAEDLIDWRGYQSQQQNLQDYWVFGLNLKLVETKCLIWFRFTH